MSFYESMILEEKIESLEFLLQDEIINIIKNNLTIELIKNGKKPFTKDELDQFIYGHEDEILYCIERIIEEYKEAGTLDDLEYISIETIQNYLYSYVDFNL